MKAADDEKEEKNSSSSSSFGWQRHFAGLLLMLGEQQPSPLDPGLLVLRDDEKVLSRFCYRDGVAQKIRGKTKRIWLLGCMVPGFTEAQVRRAMDSAIEKLSFCSNSVQPDSKF